MSYADNIFIENCKRILSEGFWDTDHEVRPHWEDGTPAHTIKLFGLTNRYDLREEFPIHTIRKINFKGAVDEILWIWQRKSNNIHDLKPHIWDDNGKAQWFGYEPTDSEFERIQGKVESYIEMYADQEMHYGGQMMGGM